MPSEPIARRSRLAGLLVALALGCTGAEQGPEQAAAQLDPRLARLNDPEIQNVEPFPIFDNLYYVGMEWVSCYLLTTSEGLVLIDSLYGDFVDHAVEGIQKLGFDPEDIEYVLVTHGHSDHVGGAREIRGFSGARVGLTEADWMLAEEGGKRRGFEVPPRDLVLSDGDTITLGDTEIRFFVTPGHTEGVLSMEFTVYDRGVPHKAFTFGGVGLNFSGIERTRMYLDSVRRIQTMEGIEVNVTNHAAMGKVFERAEVLGTRGPEDPHPFVDPAGFAAWLEQLLENAQTKLEEEIRNASAG